MGILFVHDHVLRQKIDESHYFTSGGFADYITERYTSIFGAMTLLCRGIASKKIPEGFMEIKNPLVSVVTVAPKNVNYGLPSLKVVKEEVQKADAVIIRLPSRLGVMAVHYAREYKKPYLVECVACPWDSYRSEGVLGKLVAPFMWLGTRLSVRNAPYCLYVTQHFLQKRYPCKGITLGCSDAEISIASSSVLERRRSHFEKMGNRIVLGTLARVDLRYKGQEDVIRALSLLKRLRPEMHYVYHLAGQGDQDRLRKEAHKYGVDDDVIFDGSLTHSQVFDWLDSIDVYVQPSRQEGLPRSLVEALGRACPAVGSTAGGIPELLDAQYMYNAGNIKSLAKILANITPNRLCTMSYKNFELAKKYDVSNLSEKRKLFYRTFKMALNNTL